MSNPDIDPYKGPIPVDYPAGRSGVHVALNKALKAMTVPMDRANDSARIVDHRVVGCPEHRGAPSPQACPACQDR